MDGWMDGWVGMLLTKIPPPLSPHSLSPFYLFLICLFGRGCERERKEKRGGSSLKGVGLDAVGFFMSKWE